MKVTTFLILLFGLGIQAYAGTIPIKCLDSNGTKLLQFHTIDGEQIVQGTISPSTPLNSENTQSLGTGILKITSGNRVFVILGWIQKGVIMNEEGRVIEELFCKSGM